MRLYCILIGICLGLLSVWTARESVTPETPTYVYRGSFEVLRTTPNGWVIRFPGGALTEVKSNSYPRSPGVVRNDGFQATLVNN